MFGSAIFTLSVHVMGIARRWLSAKRKQRVTNNANRPAFVRHRSVEINIRQVDTFEPGSGPAGKAKALQDAMQNCWLALRHLKRREPSLVGHTAFQVKHHA